MGGEGSLCGPALPDGALELEETTEPVLEFIRLGFKSGVPLAYMNLLAMGSGGDAARAGERRGEETIFGLDVCEERLFPLA